MLEQERAAAVPRSTSSKARLNQTLVSFIRVNMEMRRSLIIMKVLLDYVQGSDCENQEREPVDLLVFNT